MVSIFTQRWAFKDTDGETRTCARNRILGRLAWGGFSAKAKSYGCWDFTVHSHLSFWIVKRRESVYDVQGNHAFSTRKSCTRHRCKRKRFIKIHITCSQKLWWNCISSKVSKIRSIVCIIFLCENISEISSWLSLKKCWAERHALSILVQPNPGIEWMDIAVIHHLQIDQHLRNLPILDSSKTNTHIRDLENTIFSSQNVRSKLFSISLRRKDWNLSVW